MMQRVPLFAFALLLTLTAGSCGGALPTPAVQDLSIPSPDLAAPPPDLSSPPPDLTMCGMCECGLTLFAALPGGYPAWRGSGVIVSDTCQTGFTGDAVETTRYLS